MAYPGSVPPYGPPPDPYRSRLREQYPTLSERSFGDLYRAMKRLELMLYREQVTPEQAEKALARFQNGKPNVSEFARRVKALETEHPRR